MRIGLSALAALILTAGTALGQAYVITTAAGTGTPAGLTATSAGIGRPGGPVIDAAGRLNFVAADYYMVLRLESTGMLTAVAGSGAQGNGTPANRGDGGPAVDARFVAPWGMAFDSAGNIYVADSTDALVRKITNGVITTFAGGGYSWPGNGDNGPATSARLEYPRGLAVDSAGNLFIADHDGHRVRKVSNGTITTVAGTGTGGFSGDGGPATEAQLNSPDAVAVDAAGNLYIADASNYRIRKVSGGVITTVAGTGATGYSGDGGQATSATLGSFSGIAVDAAGNLYIADLSNERVRKIAGGIITTVAGNGVMGSSGDGGSATSAQLNGPNGVTVDSAGNLYITEGGVHRIRRVAGGIITTIAGNGSYGYSGDDGTAARAQVMKVSGVAADAAGNVFVADTWNYRVRKISNGVITTVAGTGAYGYSGDNGQATSAKLSQPYSVAVDSTGNLYILDSFRRHVRKVSSGVITTIVSGLSNPQDIAVDSAGNLYIADSGNHRIQKYANGALTTVAGTGTFGFSGDNGPATEAQLASPCGIAVDSAGNLYIGDALNHRIRKVSNGVITTIAGNGTAGYGGDNGPAVSAQLATPHGVAVDAAGNVYIADFNSNRIRKVSNGTITTIAGDGEGAYGGDGGIATGAQVYTPMDVAVDASGNVYIADYRNNRVRQLSNTGTSLFTSVSAASFATAGPLAPGMITAGYSTNLGGSIEVAPAAGPLPTALGGTSVLIKDSTGVERAAALWFVSPGQINYLIPYETSLGLATVSVVRNSQTIAMGPLQIEAVAPGIFSMNSNGQGVPAALAVFAKPDGSQTWQYVFNSGCTVGSCVPIPIGVSTTTDQAYLLMYGTGIRGRSSLASVRATVGVASVPVEFAGPVAGMEGLDQVNLKLPRTLARIGEVDVALWVDGQIANLTRVNIR